MIKATARNVRGTESFKNSDEILVDDTCDGKHSQALEADDCASALASDGTSYSVRLIIL